MTFIRKFLNKLKIQDKEDALDISGKYSDDISEKDQILLEICQKIDKAKQIANTINTTIDRQEFVNSLCELKDILQNLTKYEDEYNFDPLPSKDLEYLERN